MLYQSEEKEIKYLDYKELFRVCVVVFMIRPEIPTLPIWSGVSRFDVLPPALPIFTKFSRFIIKFWKLGENC